MYGPSVIMQNRLPSTSGPTSGQRPKVNCSFIQVPREREAWQVRRDSSWAVLPTIFPNGAPQTNRSYCVGNARSKVDIGTDARAFRCNHGTCGEIVGPVSCRGPRRYAPRDQAWPRLRRDGLGRLHHSATGGILRFVSKEDPVSCRPPHFSLRLLLTARIEPSPCGVQPASRELTF